MTIGFASTRIAAVSHLDAPVRVASADLEARIEPLLRRIGASPGLLESLTGVTSRRWWPRGMMPSDAATMAGRRALEASGVDPARIGLLVNTSVSRDFVEPSTASLVHANLKLPTTCGSFDLSNACLGFMDAIEFTGHLIERGAIDAALIVAGESSRDAVERTLGTLSAPDADRDLYKQHLATLTLGSGAAAMVVARAELAPDGGHLRGLVRRAATEHNHLCRGNDDQMITDTQGLLVEGIALAGRTFEAARADLGWTPSALDLLVMHQVSRPHTARLCASLGLDVERAVPIYPEFGNIGPASVPIALSKARESGRLRPDDRVALMGIGSGLNCAMAEVSWAGTASENEDQS